MKMAFSWEPEEGEQVKHAPGMFQPRPGDEATCLTIEGPAMQCALRYAISTSLNGCSG